MKNFFTRLEKIESAISPGNQDIITVLKPTDEEFDLYENGVKPLPSTEIKWDFSLMTEAKLRQIAGS